MRRFLLSSWLCIMPLYGSVLADAQVDIGQLGAAQRYDSEPLNQSNGGLDPALWQGVSAERASAEIATINLESLSELPYNFMRRVLLSAGVPPEGDENARANYLDVKTQAKLQLHDYLVLNSLANPQNPQQRDARFRANLALASGDNMAACSESDREIDNRSAPFWMQMRIICHLIRDENAAAELTLNLMRERGDIDSDFIALSDTALGIRKKGPKNIKTRDPIIETLQALANPDQASSINDQIAIALNAEAAPDERLDAMFKTENRLSPEQVQSVMSSLLFDVDDLAGGASFDIDTALSGLQDKNERAKSTAQLFNLASNFSDPQAAAQAVAALLNMSETVDYVPQMTRLLGESIPFISAEDQARLDARRFTWAALRRGDLSTLRGLYQALDPDDPLAGRIALASDALGNGFLLGQLGTDIQTRLNGEGPVQANALRDALIGFALGAQMSDASFDAFKAYNAAETINPAVLAQLKSAADSGARAHLLIMIAETIGDRDVTDLSNLEIYSYIAALSDAGLTREAGELAAYDFLSRIPAAAIAE